MKTKLRRTFLPFGYKLMLSYCVFIIVPVLLVGYVANAVFVGSIQKQTRSNIQGTLKQMADNIAYKLEDTTRISDMLYFDKTLAGHLRHYEEGWVSYSATTQYLLPKFQTTVEATNRKIWLTVYLHNETLPEIYNDYKDTDPLDSHGRLFDLYHIDRIAEKPWYRDFPKENYGTTLQWKEIEDDRKFGRISLLRRIVDVSNPIVLQEIGFLRISVRLSELFESVDYRKIGEGSEIFMVDDGGRIVNSSGTADYRNGDVWHEEKAGDHLVIQELLPGLPWKLTALVPTDITDRDTDKVRLLTFAICAASFLFFAMAGIFISRYFARRVNKIVSVLDSFQEGSFHKQIHFKGSDEFSRIAEAINDMGQNIGQLIQEVYLSNIKKKEAELESLQAQINPHFLYNTLSSISRLAKFGETEKLHRMVMDLAKFYRLSLNEGRTVIPVSDELEQAKAYIDIQKTKYEDRMTVHYDIDPGIQRYRTVKLILQPFIENALQHAWYGDRITIRVAGYLDRGCVMLKVIDDGIGIQPERLRHIFDPVESVNAGYGIRNVDERIKLHYGKEYGVKIHSKPGAGTTVLIAIPAREAEQEAG